MVPVIREIDNNDFYAVAQLIKNELGYSNLDYDRFLGRMNFIKSDPNHITFVAQSSGQIVGFIGLTKGIAFEIEGQYLRIIALAVSQSQQNQGIGTALLRHAEEFASMIGISVFALNSGLNRVEAHAFYKKNGYIKRSYGFSKNI